MINPCDIVLVIPHTSINVVPDCPSVTSAQELMTWWVYANILK